MNNNANPESFPKIQANQYELPRFIESQMLPTGVHLFVSSPKIGKLWLALWLYDKVAKNLSEPIRTKSDEMLVDGAEQPHKAKRPC